jgi:hypothetical protein
MNAKILIILFIVGFAFFVLGGGVGIIYQKQHTDQIVNQLPEFIDNLQSKVISSVLVSGTVVRVSEKNIILNNNGNEIEIPLSQDAKIISLINSYNEKDQNLKTEKSDISLKNIKVGDKLNVKVRILSDGKLEGYMVTVVFP